MKTDVYAKMEVATSVFGVWDSTGKQLCGDARPLPYLFASRKLAAEWCEDQGFDTTRVQEIQPRDYKEEFK